jgi:DNA-nicking Smr family endonuclease
MARKKASRKKSAASQAHNNSPFKSLKGLLLSGGQPSSATSSGKDCGTDTGSCRDCDDQNAFADEMAILGVNPLPDRREEAVEPDKQAAEQSFETPGQSRHERDTAIFLEAVSDITTVFKDEELDSVPARQGGARRMKQLGRGQLKPEAVVDLHGLTIAEATTKVHFFLQNAVHHNLKTLLIITGKGLHSGDGPVLKEAVEKLLDQSVDSVLEWGIAPRRYGGTGALVVFLRTNVLE